MGYIKLSLEDSPEADSILKYINRMMANNKNYLNVVTGATGSGKSYSCLRLAELWYDFYFQKEFPQENICFTVEALVKRLGSGELRKGDLLIAEEIGVGANSKNFQSKTNKALQFILQSFRSLNIIVLFNVPHFSFFDKTARMLMHSHFQTVKINKREEKVILKPYFLNISQQTGKIYTKWMRVTTEKGTRKITRLALAKPSPDVIKVYEEMKDRFVRGLIREMEVTLVHKLEKERNLKELTPRQAEVFELLKEGLTGNEMAKKLGRSASDVSKAKNEVRKKGYAWDLSDKTKIVQQIDTMRENL